MASVADGRGAPSEVRGAPAAGNGPDIREKKRRRRTRPHEVDILMSTYLQNPFPNDKTRERLAQSVGMTPRAVSIWFQNRRQAEKKRSQRYGGSGIHPAAPVPLATRVPVQPLDLAYAHGLRDLHTAARPLPDTQRRDTMCRTRSSPCMSLTTNAQGHAQLGPAGASHASAIWQRMESSSAVNSSSDVDEPAADRSHDEDEEEMTLRRLAQRRSARKRAVLDASDARQMLQTCRPSAARALKRQASLSLEFAAAREMSPEHPPKPVRRTESMPVRAPLRPIQPMPMPRHGECMPCAGGQENLPRLAVPEQLPAPRPVAGFRRVASATARLPRESSFWSRAPPIPVVRRESSARSDAKPQLRSMPPKAEEHDDSGFFEEDSLHDQHSSPESTGSARQMPTPTFTEHDRQAVELLLGLGSIPAGNK